MDSLLLNPLMILTAFVALIHFPAEAVIDFFPPSSDPALICSVHFLKLSVRHEKTRIKLEARLELMNYDARRDGMLSKSLLRVPLDIRVAEGRKQTVKVPLIDQNETIGLLTMVIRNNPAKLSTIAIESFLDPTFTLKHELPFHHFYQPPLFQFGNRDVFFGKIPDKTWPSEFDGIEKTRGLMARQFGKAVRFRPHILRTLENQSTFEKRNEPIAEWNQTNNGIEGFRHIPIELLRSAGKDLPPDSLWFQTRRMLKQLADSNPTSGPRLRFHAYMKEEAGVRELAIEVYNEDRNETTSLRFLLH